MQKNLPKYTPDWVRTDAGVGGGVAPRGLVRALQRPPHAALVRQPAGGRVPPDAGTAADAATTRPTWSSTWTRRRATAFDAVVGAALLVRAGAGRRRAGRRGEDQRRQGRARLRPDRPAAPPSRTWPPRPGRSPPAPSGSTRRWPPPRTSRRTGTARCSSTRPGPAGRPWWPRTARGCGPGMPVSFPVGWDDLDDVTPADFTIRTRAGAARRRRPVGRADAGAAAAPRRPGRRGSRPSRWPGCRPCTRASAGPGPAARPADRRAGPARPVLGPGSTPLAPGEAADCRWVVARSRR